MATPHCGNSRSPVFAHNQEPPSCDKKYLNVLQMTQNILIMLIALGKRKDMTFETTWVEFGEILYLTIAREAKSLEIAASDDLLAFGFIYKCLAEDAEDLKKSAINLNPYSSMRGPSRFWFYLQKCSGEDADCLRLCQPKKHDLTQKC